MANFCSKCGSALTGSKRFCGQCGAPAPVSPNAAATAGLSPLDELLEVLASATVEECIDSGGKASDGGKRFIDDFGDYDPWGHFIGVEDLPVPHGDLTRLAAHDHEVVRAFVARTETNSPFGFVVLDDPVQAMDTAKVAAFAHVLARIAATRQVLVFTHDERFVSAVRHLDSGAAVRILQVERGPRSTMQVTGMGR